MSTESSFDAFCAAQSQLQRQDGHPVPSKASRSFTYYQWLEVAKEKFHDAQTEEVHLVAAREPPSDSPRRKKLKTEPDNGAEESAELPSVLPFRENVLAEVLAEQLRASLRKQVGLAKAPASLRHAAQESFPMPPAAADMPAFLALAEATIRLTLWHPKDKRLSQLASRLRPNLRTLEESHVIGLYQDSFPSLQLLMDVLSWRIIVHRWEVLPIHLREVVVDSVRTLCSYVEGPASAELQAVAEQTDCKSDTMPVPLKELDRLAGAVSATIPFQFAACRDLASLYGEPKGVLRVPPSDTAAPASTATPNSIKRERQREDVQVGALIGANPAPTTPETQARPNLEEPNAAPQAVDPFTSYAPHAMLDVVPRTEAARPSFHSTTEAEEEGSSGAHQNPASNTSGQPACLSRFHARYADPSKHASSECHYCATCHLLEIIFGGDRRLCRWRHWPSRRKIMLHLKPFPEVVKLALQRLAEMERGVQLDVMQDMPC